MRSEQISDALNYLDDELVMETGKARSGRKRPGGTLWRWGVLAACLCLAAAAAVRWLPDGGGTQVIPPGLDVPFTPDSGEGQITPDSGEKPSPATSNTYHTLDELLAYLSGHDSHGSGMGEDGGGTHTGSTGASVTEGTSAAAYQGYAYHIGKECVIISALDGTGVQSSIDFPAQSLFLWRDRLALVREFVSGGSERNKEHSVCLQLYNLNDPAEPALMDEYVQRGSLTACWMDGGTLYLLTGDGVCACGWSRLADTSGYVPQLSVNGTAAAWGDEDIRILGEPVRVEYTAATALDAATGDVADKQAFYGSIEEVFYGPGWLALLTKEQTETVLHHPEIYTFRTDGEMAYTGKISLAGVLALEPSVKLKDGKLPDGEYPAVWSVSREEGLYRIVGSISGRSGERTLSSLLALTADMTGGEYRYKVLDTVKYPYLRLADLDWEPHRAIVCASTMERTGNSIEKADHFFFAVFSGMEIKWYESGLSASHVSGVDMLYSYGSPFGQLDSLIPLGDGIYLRYNEKPDGLDIYDFSDSAAPRLLYRSRSGLPEEERFEFQWEGYDQRTFGIMHVTLGPDGSGRNAAFSWRIYAVDPAAEAPYTLLAEYPLGESPGWGGEPLKFTTFTYEGKRWYVTWDSEVPVPMPPFPVEG